MIVISFCLPFLDRPLLCGEVDAHLYHLSSVSFVGDRVAFVFDLPECLVDAAVDFQFHHIDGRVGLEQYVHTSLCRAHLSKDVTVEEGKHHVEHGSEVSFAGGRIFQRVALIGNRGKEST